MWVGLIMLIMSPTHVKKFPPLKGYLRPRLVYSLDSEWDEEWEWRGIGMECDFWYLCLEEQGRVGESERYLLESSNPKNSKWYRELHSFKITILILVGKKAKPNMKNWIVWFHSDSIWYLKVNQTGPNIYLSSHNLSCTETILKHVMEQGWKTATRRNLKMDLGVGMSLTIQMVGNE